MAFDHLLRRYFNKPCTPRWVLPLQGDASSRRYYRIKVKEDWFDGSLIAMVLPEEPMKSDEVIAGALPSKLPFVNMAGFLGDNGIRVPEVYIDATDEGVLLLEDLGDKQLVDCVKGSDDTTVQAWYGAAVALLAKMHDRMWPLPKGSIAAERTFDYNLLRWELDHYVKWGIEAVFGPLDLAVRADLDTAFDALATEIGGLPRGFVHRDYQSRNLMVLGSAPTEANLAVIDFQDALEGPRVYDLVALLNDSYVSLEPRMKQRIIEQYAAARGLEEAALAREFQLVTVQRKLKDGGRFVFIDRVKKNPSYLPFVDTSFRRAKESLDALSGHEMLKAALRAADPTRFGPRG